MSIQYFEPVKKGDSGNGMDTLRILHWDHRALKKASTAHFVGSISSLSLSLGFRSAPPQALCCHPLCGLEKSVLLTCELSNLQFSSDAGGSLCLAG